MKIDKTSSYLNDNVINKNDTSKLKMMSREVDRAGPDTVEVSEIGRMLNRLKQCPEVRQDVVDEVKKKIRNGIDDMTLKNAVISMLITLT